MKASMSPVTLTNTYSTVLISLGSTLASPTMICWIIVYAAV